MSYITILFLKLQITRSDIRTHIKWAVSLVIAYGHFIFLGGLCGYRGAGGRGGGAGGRERGGGTGVMVKIIEQLIELEMLVQRKRERKGRKRDEGKLIRSKKKEKLRREEDSSK